MMEGNTIKRPDNIIEFPTPAGKVRQAEKQYMRDEFSKSGEQEENTKNRKMVEMMLETFVNKQKNLIDRGEADPVGFFTDRLTEKQIIERVPGAFQIEKIGKNDEQKEQFKTQFNLSEKQYLYLYDAARDIRDKYTDIKDEIKNKELAEARKKAEQAFADEDLPEAIAVNEE
jgi:hypothetical protein